MKYLLSFFNDHLKDSMFIIDVLKIKTEENKLFNVINCFKTRTLKFQEKSFSFTFFYFVFQNPCFFFCKPHDIGYFNGTNL